MLKNLFISALCLGFANLATAQTDKISTETGTLTTAELTLLSKFSNEKQPHGFPLSKKVKRYYQTDAKKQKRLTRTELIFDKTQLQTDKAVYVFAEVYFSGDAANLSLYYAFSEGSANTVTGSVITMGENSLQSEIGCGTSACVQTVLQNGKVVYSK